MKFDVVILSYANNDYLKQVTLNCLNTLIGSESDSEIEFNPIVFESEWLLEPYQYPFSQTIYKKEKFHYNRFMNYGFEMGDAPYVAFCNNDLEFKDNWASNIIYYMNKYNINSATPLCNLYYKNRIFNEEVILGNEVGVILGGWCIVVRRDFFKQLGKFDERVAFYCSDNIYNEQLKSVNEKHALITRSHVNHLAMTSINTLDETTKYNLCVNETKKFNQIFDKNILGYGK